MSTDPNNLSETITADHTKRSQPLFSVSATLETDRQARIKPLYISLGLRPSDFTVDYGGISGSVSELYTGPKSVFNAAVAGSGPFADRIWFFKGDSYFRYFEKNDGDDEISEILPILGNWRGWPERFETGIDAALQGRGAYQDKMWFFKDAFYIRYSETSDSIEQEPHPIGGEWRGVPDTFASGIDAAIHGIGQSEDVCWLFKGPNYVRYDLKANQTTNIAPISQNWGCGNWPAEFSQGIDFAFYGKGMRDAENIYFFRGGKFFIYHLATDTVVAPPRPIAERWPLLKRFMPSPQLFIEEIYDLHTFHGEMGRGELVDNKYLGPGEKTEYKIVTKRTETIKQSVETNILESTSDKAVAAFSNGVKSDTSEASGTEQSDFEMDAHFQGEAQATSLTGGEAKADLNAKTKSQNVRNSRNRALSNELRRSSDRTQEAHKQQVSVQGKDYEIKTEVEEGFTRTISNEGNNKEVNMILYQLTQEYIVILCLIDARLVFCNGDPQMTKSIPIREMDRLLSSCISEASVRNALKDAIRDILNNIVDYKENTRSLLMPSGSGSSELDTNAQLVDTIDIQNSTGQQVRTISVPGMVLKIDRAVVLTPYIAMAILDS